MKNKGYTLIELAIVILIVGFITGAVMTARSLINQAYLRTIIEEQKNNFSAMSTFYMKFGYLPGDIPNATSYWYNASTCPGTAGTAGQCNGNGNGNITASGVTDSDEALRAWQHLGLAGLISGSYTGVYATANQNDIGVNVPSSKFPSAGWFIYHLEPPFWGVAQNSLFIGAFVASNNNNAPILSCQDAYSIDNKIDDGMPFTGFVRPGSNGHPYWCTNSASGNQNYLISQQNSINCSLAFLYKNN